MTPRELVAQLKSLLQDWTFDAISMGFPAPVRNGCIMTEPKHLGAGWTRFNFEKSLGKPVRIINDAAMQALGSYRGRRMLFLGLGTGLGSTLIWENNVLPLELGDLAVWQRPHHRGLPRQVRTERARRKAMARRSPSCRHVVEEIADCRLRRSRRRQREEIGSTAGRRGAGTQSKRFPRRRSPLANRPAHPQGEVANPVRN